MKIDETHNQQAKRPNTSEMTEKEVVKPLEGAPNSASAPAAIEKSTIFPKNKKPKKRKGSTPKYLLTAIIALILAGVIFYFKPALVSLISASQSTTPIPSETIEPARGVDQTVPEPKVPSKQDRYQTKLAEAATLREELLRKREEILDLKLYYQNGINELKKVIIEEARRAQIGSYAHAIKNKRIELHLRIIQRRLAYIHELDKPQHWVEQASEELLFLIRKMQIDLKLKDMANGIDFDNQAEHLNAVIQKYRPNAEKLVMSLKYTENQPLTSIWHEIESQISQETQIAVAAGEEDISKEICSGNFERVAELNTISEDTARCLSRMNRSDLVLNKLTTLTPTAAKYLFQWQGNWICLNGFKKLSPSVGKYLFQWGGDWISLNGLIEFPPQLAAYLLNWKGQQLELMGLKSGTTRNSLKQLVLWERSGGKLYVSEDIRKEMQGVI
jgi:hypothetical protein